MEKWTSQFRAGMSAYEPISDIAPIDRQMKDKVHLIA